MTSHVLVNYSTRFLYYLLVSITNNKFIKMKKTIFALLALFALVSCGGDEPTPQPKNYEGTLVVGILSENTTWYSDSIYTLRGRVIVPSGITLTIEPGVVVKGDAGNGSTASSLIIARGGKINAVGTPGAPIIFTSVIDSIQPGQIVSPNLDENVAGLWGGLLVLGYAPISAGTSPLQIEGIPSSESNGLYGGNDSLDNSGILQYISIRHGGTNIGQGNEINGLTLGGVGKGTTIDHIEVVANQDDGIECFGGNVKIQHALVWGQQDDAFDIDQAFSGLFESFVSIAASQHDHALEIDGGEGQWNAPFTMWGGTIIDTDTAQIHFRDGAEGYVSFNGVANIEADLGTSVVVDTLHAGAQLGEFNWTWAKAAGKL